MSAVYRLYILDTHDRSIVEVIEIGACSTDEAAVDKAAPFIKQQSAELWDRARKVCDYEQGTISREDPPSA